MQVLKRALHRAKEQQQTEVLGACDRCIAFYMHQEAGLLYTMQAGAVEQKEKAAAAIWHMSAHRPKVRGAILCVHTPAGMTLRLQGTGSWLRV